MNMYIKNLSIVIFSTAGIHAAEAAHTYRSCWDITQVWFAHDLAALQNRNAKREEVLSVYLRSFNRFTDQEIQAQLNNLTDISSAAYTKSNEWLAHMNERLQQEPVWDLADPNSLAVYDQVIHENLIQSIQGAQENLLILIYPNGAISRLLNNHATRMTPWRATATPQELRQAYRAEWDGAKNFVDFLPKLLDHHKKAMRFVALSAYLGILKKVGLNSPECVPFIGNTARDRYQKLLHNKQEYAAKLSFTLDVTREETQTPPSVDKTPDIIAHEQEVFFKKMSALYIDKD